MYTFFFFVLYIRSLSTMDVGELFLDNLYEGVE